MSKLNALLENRFFDNFWELFALRILGRKTGLTVYRLNDWRIIVDHEAGDQNGTKACLVSPMYRDFFQDIELPSNPNILDVGGNGGGFVLLSKHLIGTLGKVVSLEFNPDTYKRLWYNLTSNLEENIVVLNAAASNKNGTCRVADEKGSTSAKPGDALPESKEVEIETITLDEVMKRHYGNENIDLCKIDIEGCEYDFLLSEEADSISKIQNLIIEIHPVEDTSLPEKLVAHIQQSGFTEIAKADPMHGDVRLFSRK